MNAFNRLRFAWLALLLALSQTAMPPAAYAQPSSGAGLLVEICLSGGGIKRVSLGANGVPVEAPTGVGEQHGSHCPLCSGSATPAASTPVTRIPAAGHAGSNTHLARAEVGPMRRTSPATGPPTRA